jgi:uncharacterized protein YndB with AHSA1/START domain
MSTETVLVSEVIPAPKERLYAAWLDSDQHSAFTADSAAIEPYVGGTHSAFGGYATGQVLALEPNRRIVQSWRSSDFPAEAADSRLEVTFEDTSGGTMITLLHTGIPSGQSDRYRESWLNYYFERMKKYFAAGRGRDGSDFSGGQDEEEDDDETEIDADAITQVMNAVKVPPSSSASSSDDGDDDLEDDSDTDSGSTHNGARSSAPPPARRASPGARSAAARPAAAPSRPARSASRPGVKAKGKPTPAVKAKAKPAAKPAKKAAARRPAKATKVQAKGKAPKSSKAAVKKAAKKPLKKAKPAKKRGR